LEKRKDRLYHFIEEANRENLPKNKISVFKAFDGTVKDFKISPILANMFLKSSFLLFQHRNPAIANQLSHYFIIKNQILHNYKNIIIFQDDVKLKSGFISDLIEVLNNLPNDFEILWLGFHKHSFLKDFIPWDIDSHYDENDFVKKLVNNHVCILKDDINPCSLAYVISLEGAKNWIEHVEKNGFEMETDHNFNNYLKSKNIFYSSRKVLCTGNNKFSSDIFK
jgi:GR25 family glycosyltransferase involved in LPS biosynthesis